MAAALGMAVGLGEYLIAFYCTFLAFIVLIWFVPLQNFVFKLFNKTIELHLTFDETNNQIDRVEGEMIKLQLKYCRKKEFKKDNRILFQYDVIGREPRLEALVKFLNSYQQVKSFDY